MWLIGIPIGLFIGTLSGISFLLILRTAFEGKGIKHVTALIGEIAALASFSLGGKWLADGSLEEMQRTGLLGPYLLSFITTFFIIAAKSLYRTVVRLGNQIGQQEYANND
jgi:hypothetical protein